MDTADIDTLCRLSRLRLAGEERAALERDLEAILRMTDLIRAREDLPPGQGQSGVAGSSDERSGAYDRSGVDGCSEAEGRAAALVAALSVDELRPDRPRPGWPAETALAQAPRQADGFYFAPPVMSDPPNLRDVPGPDAPGTSSARSAPDAPGTSGEPDTQDPPDEPETRT